uniref:Uncharacterized protein n=1 Tax=Fagus sylvatica TaxID=28930 RepID=A0A2N9GYV2_FAGSY
MAESVVSGVVSRLGDLLLQEANLLMQGRMNQRLVRQWVSEIRELAYDADDIIGTYALNSCIRRQEGRRHKEGPQERQRDEIGKLRDDEIVEKLLQVQQARRKCLVIVDDIWNTEHWDILCKAFPVKDTGSKILLTTRNRDVALHADPRGFLHNLQFLNDQKSWELLEKIAISWREDSIIKTNMESLGNEMLKYCGGLPLAITVLGGLLAAKHTQEEWDDVHRHVKSYLNVQEGLQFNKDKVLALSYNELPCHLKPCFLYLGHFPEDFEISTKELVRMWMAEGFIQKIQHERGREDTMEDVGERYLQELVQRCMVLPKQENFLQITNIRSMEESEAHIGKIRRLAINVESDDDYLNVKGIKFNEHPYLRSLLYFGPLDFPFKESRFKKFKLLRVLNLENFENYHIKLPKDIGCLIHLRFLSLKGSNVNNVPSSMGNLRCLQTLDLRFLWKRRVRVPNVFKKMEQLRHLYLPYSYRISEKLEVGNLCYLQTLVNVWPKKIRLPTSFTFNRLRVLKLGSVYGEAGPDIIEKLNVRSYFEGSPDIIQILSSCPHIYNLHLEALKIKKLPEVHQFSSNLAKLTLGGTCLEEDPMATLEKLPNLKILRLLGNVFVGKNMVCSERGFPQLQSLVLDQLQNQEEWRVEEGAMPSLCRLQIDYCHELKTIPDGLRFVTTLQELEIKRMPKTFKDRVDKGGEDFCKVQHVPSLVFQHCDRD